MEYLLALWLASAIITHQDDYDKLDKALSGVDGIKLEDRSGSVVIFFNNSFFDIESAELNMEGIKIAKKVSEAIADKLPPRYVYIEGHSDNTGSHEYNMDLSIARAKAFAKVAIKNGVDIARIDIVGYGDTEPSCDNKTEEGRSCNRRVQIAVFKKRKEN